MYRKSVQREKKILEVVVVDDQSQMRDIIRVMLRNNRYGNVYCFESGKQALKFMAHRPVPINLVITDWHMPNMTGVELLMQIKSDPTLFSLPVIMISDEHTDEKVMYALEEGVDGFLVKPFSENVFINNVKQVLARAQTQDPLLEKIAEMRRLKLSKNYQEALELGYEILKIRHNPRAALMTCECLYQVEDYDRAISIMSDTDEENKTSQQTNLRGKIYMKLGRHAEGLVALEEAVKMNPLSHDRKVDLAGAYFSLGKDKEAEKIINAIANANPTDMNLVSIAELYLDRDDIEMAGKYLKQTVDPLKDSVPIFNNYAIALRKAGKFEEAADIYRKCLKTNPDSDVLYYNLALLYTKTNKRAEAKDTLTQALKLNPDNTYARDLLKRIESMSST
jgi:two-component system, chemotaxis family, chemotaxis protein CheY